MTLPRVRAVVLDHDGGDMTMRALEALDATEWPHDRLEIHLVDNASERPIVDRVASRLPHVHVHRSDVNRGFAGGNNVALRNLEGVDLVALVNNDVTVDPGWLRPLANALAADPGIGAASPRIVLADRFLEILIEAPTTRPGCGDRRALGVHISGVRVDGKDVSTRARRADGWWGLELLPGDDAAGEWTMSRARLLVPLRGPDTPGRVELRLAARSPRTVRVTSGPSSDELHVMEDATWRDVPAGGAPQELLHNVGTFLTADYYGADRGYLEPALGSYPRDEDVFAWCGAAVLLRAAYLEDVGLFDERLFLYSEDLDLAWRGLRSGWRHRYIAGSVVRHLHSATVARAHAAWVQELKERNHLLVVAHNAGGCVATRVAMRHALVTASYARRDVVAPALRGEPPTTTMVRLRIRAFARFLGVLARDRRRWCHSHERGVRTGSVNRSTGRPPARDRPESIPPRSREVR